jgi:hypothetical protein
MDDQTILELIRTGKNDLALNALYRNFPAIRKLVRSCGGSTRDAEDIFQEGSTDSCTAVWNLLCKSFGTSPTVKGEFESKAIIKEKEVGLLKSYAQKENLWLRSLPPGSQYLTEAFCRHPATLCGRRSGLTAPY